MTLTYVDAGPIGEVAVRVAGSGPLLLCLHGIGSGSAAFDRQLDELGARYRVVAWDAPGYGRSPDVHAPPGMDGYAEAAATLITSHGGPAAVLGVSWGGVIATRLALNRPDLVDALVLAGSSVGAGATAAGARAMQQRVDDLMRRGPIEFARSRAPKLLSPEADQGLVDRVTHIMASSVRMPGYRWAAEAMAATDHTSRLADLRVDTLVVSGAEDSVTGPAASEVLSAGIPNARAALIPRAGHLVNQEAATEFCSLVKDFIDNPDRRSRTNGH